MKQNTDSTAALRWIVNSVAIAFVLVFTQPVIALDFDGDFSVGASATDNIALVPSNGIDETIAQLGANLNFTENSRRMNADFRSTITYYDYLDDTFEDETVAAAVAFIDWNIIDNVVRWVTTDNYGRSLFDPFQPARPENQENINIFTTGPNVTFFQNARNSVGLDLSYTNMNYEIRPFDNDRLSGRIFFGRELRTNHNLSLNVSAEKTEFDNDGSTPDFDRRSLFVRYQVRAARTDVDLDIGYSEQEILDTTSDGILFNLSISRQITSNSRMTFVAGSQFADQANVFRLQQDASRDIDSLGDVTENGSPFRMNNIGVGYTLQAGRTNVALNIGLAEQDFEGQPGLDRDDVRADLFVSRDFSRSFFGSVDLVFARREFQNVLTEDDTIVGAVSVGYRFRNSLSVSLRLSHNTRESDNSANNFDENRIQLLLTYTPRWAQR